MWKANLASTVTLCNDVMNWHYRDIGIGLVSFVKIIEEDAMRFSLLHWDVVERGEAGDADRRSQGRFIPVPARGQDLAFKPMVEVEDIQEHVTVRVANISPRMVRPKYLREPFPQRMSDFADALEVMVYEPEVGDKQCVFCKRGGGLRCPVCNLYTHEACAIDVFIEHGPYASAETLAVMSELRRDFADIWLPAMNYVTEKVLGDGAG